MANPGRASFLTHALVLLSADVFFHPLWLGFKITSPAEATRLAGDLQREVKRLAADGARLDACRAALACAYLQNQAGRWESALETLRAAEQMARRAGLAEAAVWAGWGACAVCIQAGEDARAMGCLRRLEQDLYRAGQWVLADVIDLLRQSVEERYEGESLAPPPGAQPRLPGQQSPAPDDAPSLRSGEGEPGLAAGRSPGADAAGLLMGQLRCWGNPPADLVQEIFSAGGWLASPQAAESRAAGRGWRAFWGGVGRWVRGELRLELAEVDRRQGAGRDLVPDTGGEHLTPPAPSPSSARTADDGEGGPESAAVKLAADAAHPVDLPLAVDLPPLDAGHAEESPPAHEPLGEPETPAPAAEPSTPLPLMPAADQIAAAISPVPPSPSSADLADDGEGAGGVRFSSPPAADSSPFPLGEGGEGGRSSSPSLALYCLGAFKVFLNNQLVTGWSGQKGPSILKYLAANRERPVAKDILMDLFWPEAGAEVARRNLHQAIYGLRQTLRRALPDAQLILFENDCYRISGEAEVWLDFEEFERFVHAGRAHADAGRANEAVEAFAVAEQLYSGDFLEEELYEDWPQSRREYLRTLYLEAAAHISASYIQKRQTTPAMMLCQKVLSRDHCNEQAYRGLIQCYLIQGQRQLAIREYQVCVQTLKEELGLPPSKETQALYRGIVGG